MQSYHIRLITALLFLSNQSLTVFLYFTKHSPPCSIPTNHIQSHHIQPITAHLIPFWPITYSLLIFDHIIPCRLLVYSHIIFDQSQSGQRNKQTNKRNKVHYNMMLTALIFLNLVPSFINNTMNLWFHFRDIVTLF